MSTDPNNLPPLPSNHLSHPENWATGSEPVTSKQEGFIKVLEGQHKDLVPDEGIDTTKLSKSDASDVIDKLKNGKKVDDSANDPDAHVENNDKPPPAGEKEETSSSSKRKEPTVDEAAKPDSLEAAQAQTENGESTSNGVTSATGEVKKAASTKKEGPPAKKAKKEGAEKTKEGEGETAEDPIEVDTPPTEEVATPAEPTEDTSAKNGNGAKAENGNGKKDETIPGDEGHLDHPENWATGDEPATEKQKGFIKVLEKQKGASEVVGDVDSLGKSEASEKIDELKNM